MRKLVPRVVSLFKTFHYVVFLLAAE